MKFLDEKGSLSVEAKRYVNDKFSHSVDDILNIAESESDLRIIGSLLSSLIGEKVSMKVLKFKNEKK